MDKELLIECYKDYKDKKNIIFSKINDYYDGKTDSLNNFKPIEGRSNLKIKTNFMAKLVDEEASYSFSNDVTYTAKDGNEQVIKDIDYYLSNKKMDHDINLGTELVKYCGAFEISYLKNNSIKLRIVTPLNGYVYFDEDDEVEFFFHIFSKGIGKNKKNYIDVYDKNYIYHFDEKFNEVAEVTPHIFGFVPVGVGYIGDLNGSKTIYSKTKTIQDAFETNFSDITCEISDFRNAILKTYGISLDDEDEEGNKVEPIMKNNNILSFTDKSKEDAEWLIKNINDTFIKNTLDRQLDLIYTLTNHINNNEKMQSNLSGIALRSRLQQLEAKCKLNEKAMGNILQTRLRCLFRFLEITQNKKYDVNNIKIQFTPCIPVDTTQIADIISKIPHEVVSNETKRSLLPFVENPLAEGKRIEAENKANMELFPDLDNLKVDENNDESAEI